MADLSGRSGRTDRPGKRRFGATERPRDGERAQLILIGGFALAVTLIALALVMNAAIYTENLATRSEAVGPSNAYAYQRATTNAATEAFHYAHDVNNGTYAELDDNVTDAMEEYNRITSRQEVTTGRVVNVSVSTTEGTNITSTDSSDYTDASGNQDWIMASGVTGVRNFTMTVDDSGGDLVAPGAGTDEFRLVARGASERWYLNVTEDPSSGQTIVGVNASGDYDTCTTSLTTFEIDVSAGQVAGTSCDALNFSETPDSYTLRFQNATNVAGSYSLVVNVSATGLSGYSGGPPKAQPALYSMTVEVVYETSDMRYRTDVRIAPGEEDA